MSEAIRGRRAGRLPEGYKLKRLSTGTYWWVDGRCGYRVASGCTAAAAVAATRKKIAAVVNEPGQRPVWYWEPER